MTRLAHPLRDPTTIPRIRPAEAPPAHRPHAADGPDRQTDPSRPGGPGRLGLDDRVERGWPALATASWVLFLLAVLVLEPAPADPEAVPSLAATLTGVVLLTGLVATLGALGSRMRVGLRLSALTGLVALGSAVACPMTGHHGFGAWWAGELAAAGLVVAVGAIGYRRARSVTD